MDQRRRAAGVIVLILTLSLSGPLASASADPVNPCHVLNKRLATLYVGTGENLRRAIDEANPGDTLHVRGTCVGIFSIDKDLTLIGHPTRAVPQATLLGRWFTPNWTVLTVGDATVTLRRLTITGGKAGRNGTGGGIDNAGTLSLTGASRVTANTAGFGGGIFNANTGVLRVQDGSTVTGNTAIVQGGGIQNDGRLYLQGDARVAMNAARVRGGGIAGSGGVTMSGHASVRRNRARAGGGGVSIGEEGLLTMNGSSSIAANRAVQGGGSGGGVLNIEGTMVLNDSASVAANKAVFGAGIANFGLSVTMNDASSVSGNRALDRGGGIYNDADAALIGAVAGGNVASNTPDDIYQVV